MKKKIYLIPGLMTDERLWSRITPLLSEYELVHIPIPKSEVFDEINDYLLTFFKNEENINLLGFSLGGYIAFYFTLKYTSRVKKLFLLASTPSSSSKKEIIRRKEKIIQIQKNGFESLSYEKALSLIEKKDDKELIDIVCKMFNDLGEENFISQLNATFNRKNYIKELISLKIPVFLSYSIDDRLLNHKAIEELNSKEHKIKMFPRKGTSHNLSLEVPEKIAKEIKEWISE